MPDTGCLIGKLTGSLGRKPVGNLTGSLIRA